MKKNLKILFGIIILFLISFNGYGFYWPIGRGGDEGPQKITSTFGEFREGGGRVGTYFENEHFHDGVDIVALDFVSHYIYGVSSEYVWERNVGYNYVLTTYHDYRHIEFPVEVWEDDYVDENTVISKDGYQASWAHLHFSSRLYMETEPYYANNPLNPAEIYPNRFEKLCEDDDDPEIDDIFITLDGEFEELDPDEIPEYTEVDIIVKAKENTTYPGQIWPDPNNGVFKIKYKFDYEWEWRDSFLFDDKPLDWDIFCVYDTSKGRTDESNFYYIITNKMNSNGNWNTGEGDNWHYVWVEAEDEQGNVDPDYSVFYVVKSTGVDETQPQVYNLSVKSLSLPSKPVEINYSLPEQSEVIIDIHDEIGRVVKNIVHVKQQPGIYEVKWEGKDNRGNFLPNGIYFCSMKAGKFEDNKKIVKLQ